MSIKEKAFGKNRENVPNWAFRLMSFIMKIMDIIGYHDKNFKTLNIKAGQTIIDYGCGPARYTCRISKAIGNNGKLIATDIHPLAIQSVNKKIRRNNLSNAQAVLSNNYSCPIDKNSADVVLALDMFHMIQDTDSLLAEFARIVKPSGIVIIEDGHQKREETREKILQSGLFTIESEIKEHVKCKIKISRY